MKTIFILILPLLLSISIFPMNYILGISINFLPLQFLIYFLLLITFSKFKLINNFIAIFFLCILSLIIIININNPITIFTNAIVISLITIYLILLSQIDSTKNYYLIEKTLLIFFIIFSLYSVFLNTNHINEYGLIIRTKGFGSGTLYAVLSLISIIFFSYKLKFKLYNIYISAVIILISVWSILLTQSRGVLLTLLISIVLINIDKIKSIIKFSSLTIIFFIFIYLLIPDFYNLGVFQRLDPSNFDSLDQFTSNRLDSQLVILSWIENEYSFLNLFLGKGLNSLKYYVQINGLEYPHFDLLYVIYDLGIFGVIVYMISLLLLIYKSKFKIYIFIYIISSFHTNMILSPALLVLIYLLDYGTNNISRKRNQNNE